MHETRKGLIRNTQRSSKKNIDNIALLGGVVKKYFDWMSPFGHEQFIRGHGIQKKNSPDIRKIKYKKKT